MLQGRFLQINLGLKCFQTAKMIPFSEIISVLKILILELDATFKKEINLNNQNSFCN